MTSAVAVEGSSWLVPFLISGIVHTSPGSERLKHRSVTSPDSLPGLRAGLTSSTRVLPRGGEQAQIHVEENNMFSKKYLLIVRDSL